MYRTIIQAIVTGLKRADIDPRHVEAWMRLTHGTLDGLSRVTFFREAQTAIGCVDASGAAESEALAMSFGIR